MLQYKFDQKKSSFYKQLREHVDDYFSANALLSVGNSKLAMKGLLLALTAVSIYTLLVFFTPGIFLAIVLCMLFGLNMAMIGFNVMHEGGHESFSRYSWVNRLAAYSLNFLGGSIYFWKRKHNVNHHTYTNIEGIDSDIDIKPFMRLHSEQPLYWYHRFQHIYWIVLYGLSYLSWILYDDFRKYFSGRAVPGAEKKSLPFKEHLIFWTTKLGYIAFYAVVPVLMVGWLSWLIGFIIVTFTCGLAISIVFQLAHVVEMTDFHSAEEQGGDHEWAMHQLATTANFGTSSKLLYWLLGGLNFQVEHHLFPRISHIHYPKISQLIKEKCKEEQIVYNEYKTMIKAIISHLRLLKHMGRPKPIMVHINNK